MSQPQIIERRRMEPARAGTHSPRRGRGRRIRAVATVVLLAVAVGVLAGFVAFRVTRDVPDRGLAAALPVDASPAQQILMRILARARNTYPAPLDQAGQAAELALTRTQATEQQPAPAADNARRPAQTGQVDQRRILSTLGVIATTAVVAMTWRRRARSHLQERA